MANTRYIAYKAIYKWFHSQKYINNIVESLSNDLKSDDKRFFDNLVNGTILYHRQLSYIISRFQKFPKKTQESVNILLLIGAYELLHQSGSKDYASVHSIVELSKKVAPHSKKFINAVLRKIVIFRDSPAWKNFYSDVSIPLGIRYSFPDWLVNRWFRQFKDKTQSLLASLNEAPVKMLIVHNQDMFEEVFSTLESLGLKPERNPYHQAFIQISSFQKLIKHPYFTEGRVSIQDVSTIFPVKLLLSSPPKNVIDTCSAPGGKTNLIRSMLPDSIKISACDISEHRLNQVKKGIQRLKLSSMEFVQADASEFSYEPSTHFLVDAPCSGFGVIRKRSDLRWRRQEHDIKDLVNLQGKILDNVAQYVLPEGKIVYSTCTIDEEENLELIYKFLQNHPEFEIEKAHAGFPKEIVHSSGAIMTFPHIHKSEGSFAVALKKT